MLRIALCDDNADHRTHIAGLLDEYLSQQVDTPARTTVFSSAAELLAAVKSAGSFDLYLLDVVMPEMSGIDLGLRLREMGDEGLIVYLTTSAEYAVDSYQARAFHYLLKPLDQDSLFPVLEQATETLRRQRTETILVKTPEALLRLPLHEILYAELYNRAIRYHLTGERTVDTVSLRGSFHTAVASLVEHPAFVLCGASFAVNLDHVRAVRKNGAVLKNGRELLLPAKACTTLKTAWLTYWLEEDSL